MQSTSIYKTIINHDEQATSSLEPQLSQTWNWAEFVSYPSLDILRLRLAKVCRLLLQYHEVQGTYYGRRKWFCNLEHEEHGAGTQSWGYNCICG